MSTKLFGAPVFRVEDARLLRGDGKYLADISFPGMVHIVIVRSPHPKARIVSIDKADACAIDGVIDVLTHADLGRAGEPVPQGLPHHGLVSATWSALAPGRVCFAGEAVAAVIAESPEIALDAAERVLVEYESEPATLTLDQAIKDDAPLVHPSVPKNIAMHLIEEKGDVQAAISRAKHSLKKSFRMTRGGGMPLETRGVAAQYDVARRELTIWSSTQEPHKIRDTVADLLGMPRHQVRCIVPDTGGGFGTKVNTHPEEIIVPWVALRLNRPARWVETRSEHMLSACQEREQIHHIEVGFDDDGVIAGLRNIFYHDMGAYAPRGGAVPHNSSSALVGPYRIPHIRSEIVAYYTNTITVGAYRGAGQPQGVFVIERLMDAIARHLGKDPADVRMANTISIDEFPYDTGLTNLLGGAVEYDSGDFKGTLRKALETAGYGAFRESQAKALKEGRLIGIGIGNYIELTGRGPWEGAGVRVEADGRVTVYTGAPTIGQGIETTLAQVCADELGVPMESITVRCGDTALIPHGIGSFASRVGVLASNAVRQSSHVVKEKILRVAEDMLEAAAADLVLEDGRVSIGGVPGRSLGLDEIAKRALRASRPDDEEPGLEAVRYFKGPKMTYSSGTHIAAVEVDVETATVNVLRYVISHDCGRIINPMIVEGQVVGGLACGIGNALLEEHRYSDEGQLLTGSFMDYAMPTACNVPPVTIVHLETPSTLNPLGVRGAGEAGTIPVPAAICNAVEDALSSLGVSIDQHPLTPVKLWTLIDRAMAAGKRASSGRAERAAA